MAERLNVLLIEDDEVDAELVRIELEQAGFELSWERVDTEPALHHALQRRWDLIISDFSMPQFNGLDAFEVFRRTQLDTPFIFVSGALGEERAVAAMRAGARDYFLKGNLARLGVAVRRELAEARVRRERREANERASFERQRLSIAVEATGAGIYEHGASASIDFQPSDRWLELMGVDRASLEEVPDMTTWLRARVHPDDVQLVRVAYEELLSGRSERCAVEMRVRNQQGQWLPLALYAKASSRDPGGRAERVVGSLMDLSVQRLLELQLRQAQKMEAVGRLAGGIAHDFNNLLTAIFSFGGFVLDGTEGLGEVHEDMLEVMRAAKKAEALTSQLLAFSRAKPVEPKVTDPNELVRDMERMLQRVVGSRVTIALALAPEIWNVRVDVGSFEQILMNLVVNARDAMPRGGTVLLQVTNEHHEGALRPEFEPPLPDGEYVCLRVSDEGEGMDEETKRRVFEPFFTTKEVGKGTGLGLSTVYSIVQQAGGHIHIDSALGRGTTFRLYFPRSRAARDLEQSARISPRLRGEETVLVVEDDEQVRVFAVHTLLKNGYDVIDVASSRQAWDMDDAALAKVQLLLVDVVMADIGGRALAEELTRRRPELGVVYMSGYVDSTQASSQRGGPGENPMIVLAKPFEARALLLKVREALDG